MIHIPRVISSQIQSDKYKTKLMEKCIYLGTDVRIEHLFKFGRFGFDARGVSMDADADLAESQIKELLFCLVYHGKFFSGDRISVYESCREAGK